MLPRSARSVCGSAGVIGLTWSNEGRAGFTTIDPPYPGEASIEQVFEHGYGGDFTASGLDFDNGSIQALRLDDDDDQVFDDGSVTFGAEARAAFASLSQTCGYVPGDSGGSFAVTAEAGPITLDGPFRLARRGPNGEITSRNADNPDDADHMVTYSIVGLPQPTLMVFFEDRTIDSDDDFQDMVVELRESLVPTPAAFTAGLALLGVCALRRRR